MDTNDKENLLSFQQFINKKDIQAFSQALMDQTIALQIENQRLKEKLAHLETLLINLPVVEISKHIREIPSPKRTV